MKFLWRLIMICCVIAAANANICLQGVAVGGGSSSGASSITFSKPASSVSGDVLLVQIGVNSSSSSAAIDTPTGWVRIREDTSGSLGQFIFYRTLTSADNSISSYTFTIPSWAGTARISGNVASLHGVRSGGVLENSYGNTSSPVLTTPSGSTAGNIWAIAAFSVANGNDVLTEGSGLTRIGRGNTMAGPNGVSTLLAYQSQTAAGTVSAKTASGSTATSADALILIQADSVTVSCGVTLVADFRFEQTAWSGASNEVLDSSGNNLHMNRNGSATTALSLPAIAGDPGTCRYGKFLRSNASDYLYRADNALLDLDSDYTITAWIKPSASVSSGLRTIVSKGNNFELHMNSSNRLHWFFRQSDGSLSHTYQSVNTISIGTWQHVAITMKSGEQKMYINGIASNVLCDSAAASSQCSLAQTAITNATGVTIGADDDLDPARYWDGDIDEVKIYEGALSATEIMTVRDTTRPCPDYIDHYQLEFSSNTALTCSPATATLKACTNSSCSTLSSGSSTVSLSASNGAVWSSLSAFTGSTSASLRKTSVGTTTLTVSSATPSAINPLQCYFGGISATCSLSFVDSGFLWTFPAANVSTGINNITANKTVNGITLQAVRTDNTTQNCAPAFTGNRSIQFSRNYLSPATGTQNVLLNGTTITNSTPLTLSFDANATTNLSLHYADAGQLQLSAQYTGSIATNDGGLTLTGSASFISKPAGFCIEALDASANPIASCASSSCAFYDRAGDDFPLRIRAMAWQVDGETGTQLCSGNSSTKNFNGSVNLSSTMTDGGNNGTLALTTATLSNGVITQSSQQISEVGRFSFTTSGSYFGLPLTTDNSAVYGRFAPYDFEVLVNSYSAACGAFTYAGLSNKTGQSFTLSGSVRARNKTGGTTSNYQGAYAKLNGGSLTFSDMIGGTASTLGDFVAPHSLGFSDGIANFAPVSATYVMNNPTAPLSIQLRANANEPVGNDATSGQSNLTSAIEFRFGRLRLDNAYGPELLPLTVPLQTEYYDGARYQLNTLDNCSTYIASAATLSNFTNNLSSGETTVNTPASATQMQNGLYTTTAPLQLTAPGLNNEGSVQLQLTVPTWLQFDWLNNNTQQAPTATLTFGRYRGSDRIIYWKEKR